MTIQAADIFLSLTKALFSDVSMVEKIEGDNLAALREFLGMLTLLLPASDHYLNKLNELYRWVQGQAGFTGAEWADHLNVSAFPKYSGQYDLCRSAHPQYHGYPCGLWILFHALTVSHYENELAGIELPGDIVAHAMNRFIPRFFSCQICAFHFAENSANIVHRGESILPNRVAPPPQEFTFNSSIVSRLPPAPVDGKTEVLWLNAIHNRVNENLRGSPTDDPFAPKLVYPHRWLCSACWIRSRSKHWNWVLGGDQRSRSALLNFLVKRYSSSRWMSDNISKSFFVSEK
ncbi:Sulfhydryl oxidase [Fasciolopsis buskii]|uniref:Sulfhydryl oxidase n=1 Tax=Fasciolopsis buskii TaxID=27845 RepID=A0A8E0RUH7_9TREM|nr:Sulfhydryl oxidase [Fasciolopsis buski]